MKHLYRRNPQEKHHCFSCDSHVIFVWGLKRNAEGKWPYGNALKVKAWSKGEYCKISFHSDPALNAS
ncbi:hypothetical protein XELAEV_18038797mg [Xenopus laevis]|uniref:Uncharacterized protein n=1 Tax=Xenopus laevis TaxID=8355 RepID=A0A974C6A0_XENLA|nr:hypothetical protein XELAEV_18038797mg [Xenopus laevis]